MTASTPAQTVARRYAEFALGLRYEDLPEAAITRARHCLADALACAIHGRGLPWSQMVLAEMAATGSGGPCALPGDPDTRLHLPQAAFALGVFAHAFELDSLRKPGAGVHPGGTVALPAWALAETTGASDADLITAIVAGCEVMFRIGAATLHTPEKAGFHAPGLTGPFGAAIVCARLMGLDAEQTANALGIAGSFAGGLLAFASSGQGGMVKRLHMGRAAESGVLAARLAARGYEAPHGVIEGRFGLLDAFCSKTDPDLLLEGLGSRYEIETLCLKRYACHITSHAPVECLHALMEREGFAGADIAKINLRGSAKLVSHHALQEPGDLSLAQYSAPFVLALAAYENPEDPSVFSPAALNDTRIRDLSRRVTVSERANAAAKGWGIEMEVTLFDGRILEAAQESFLGTPDRPFADADLEAKFHRLAASMDRAAAQALFDRAMGRGTGA